MLGMQPATAAVTNRVQSGALNRAHSSRAPIAVTVTAVAGRRTSRWPYRSTSRKICGPRAAVAGARAAATAPAKPYYPRSWDTMVTMPIPVIDRGIRATKPAAEKPRLPGGAKIRR
jgi:hypothetical protein